MKLSIVTTLYYSAAYIGEFYSRVVKCATAITQDYEIIFVNDGSPDDSLDRAVAISNSNSRVKVVDLSRNFGHHKAIMTGLMHTQSDLVFQIDVDLEEEPEILTAFYAELQKTGADVAYGVQERRKGGLFERIFGSFYYSLFNFLTDIKMPPNLLIARLMTRRYVNALLQHKENEVDLGGLWSSTGFTQVPIVVKKRSKGTTTYNAARRIGLAVRSITAFSNRPLMMIAAIGTGILFMAIAYFIYILWVYFSVGRPPDGFTTLVLSVWFLGGMTIFALGVISIYLSIIFVETKNRPYTIVRRIYKKEENGPIKEA